MFAIADLLSRGFDVLGTEFLRTGDFDRVLLRPRAAALQLVALRRAHQPSRAIAAGHRRAAHRRRMRSGVDWTPAPSRSALWAVAGGVALFFGILVLQGTLSFWTVESLEVANVLTYGGVQAAQFPLSIYSGWFRGCSPSSCRSPASPTFRSCHP